MTISLDSKEQLSILLLEDDTAAADLIGEYLELSDLKYGLVRVSCLSEGLAALTRKTFGLILLNLSLPDSQGVETLQAVSGETAGQVIIVLADADDGTRSLEALAVLQAGAQDYLYKAGLSAAILGRSIRYALERGYLLQRLESQAQDLQHREALLQRIFDGNSDAMLILREDYVIRLLNPAAAELLDADTDSLVGEIFPFSVPVGERTELEIPGAGDSTRLVELNAAHLMWEGGRALLVVLRDITQRHEVELALKREKERLSITLDFMADALIATDKEGLVERMNQEASRLTGVRNENAIGRPLGEILKLRHPKTGKTIADPAGVFLSREREEITPELGITLLRQDGGEVVVTAEMSCILDDLNGHFGCVVVLRDVTDEKRAEEELFKAEKLQSVSLLAGGIAHDFNNILTTVLGNISLTRLEMDEEGRHSDKLLSAEKAALQAKALTQQLLTLAKGGSPVFTATTIGQLVEDCAQFILRGSNVKCEVKQDPRLWAVDADKGQISQVVNNLIINADQAMPEGGVITLSVKNVVVRGGRIPALASGDYVCVIVQDNGTGITPANLKRVFDPYFTTKESGNGLGLASSYSIIKNHHGLMTVDSVFGRGSVFKVYLPRTAKKALPVEADDAEDDTIYKGHGRILVMDDMEAMMMVAGEILAVLGYEVEFSTNGTEAIAAYKAAKESGKPFDAVVFDLTVPGGMGGEEACRILAEYDPGLVAIASSGYTTSNVMSDFEGSGFKAVVPKPYRIKEMSVALHRILSP
jgi:two-component system cell cycle sensor histidine kinase/response regulator CckA